jgi:hypothetical protein
MSGYGTNATCGDVAAMSAVGSAAVIPTCPALKARDLDHLGPLLDLFGDQLAEVGGRSGQWCATQVGELCSHFGVGEARVDFYQQFL